MFLYVIKMAKYYIFLTINFYYWLLGKEKEQKKKKLFGLCFLTLIILYYKTRDPKIY